MTPNSMFRWRQTALLMLGLVLLGLWSRDYLASRRFQSEESQKLETALRVIESGAVSGNAIIGGPPASGPSKRVIQQGGVLGRIEIPRLRIRAIVAEGSDPRTLGLGVGHIISTALPGSPGNCALAGHRDTFLRGLGEVRVNDLIRVVTVERTYLYRVEWGVVVEPHRVDVLDSTTARSLTLVTCYPFAFVGPAPLRFVVRAMQVEEAAERSETAAFRERLPRLDGMASGAVSVVLTRGPIAIEARRVLQPHGLAAEGR